MVRNIYEAGSLHGIFAPMQRISAYSVVFISGFVVLSLETIGTKLFAPVIGTTVSVWAGLMAVIIAASSVGYYVGGVLTTKKWASRALVGCSLVAVSSLGIALPLKDAIMPLFVSTTSYGLASLLLSTALFFLPVMSISATTVLMTKRAIERVETIPHDAGRMYALATIGSVAGILGMSYVLIPLLPLSQIMYGLSGALGVSVILVLLDLNYSKR